MVISRGVRESDGTGKEEEGEGVKEEEERSAEQNKGTTEKEDPGGLFSPPLH